MRTAAREYTRTIPYQGRADLVLRVAMARQREEAAWERFAGALAEEPPASIEGVRALMHAYLEVADCRVMLERRLGIFDREMEARERFHLKLSEPFERMLTSGSYVFPFPTWLEGLSNEPGRDRQIKRRRRATREGREGGN